jgi:hypothetical protein
VIAAPGLALLALLQGGPPGTPIDEGIFVVREDTVEIARESFRLAHGRLSRGQTGWTLSTTIRYDRARPVVVLAPILEVTADTMPATLQYDVADPRQPSRILGELGRGRFTVRFVARTTERAREFATGPRTVLLDDSVFALYLFAGWRASPTAADLTAILPHSLRRETIAVQDLGTASTRLNRDPATLRHVTLTGGPNGLVHLWFDTGGRLMKVEIPSRRLSVERSVSD